MLDATSAADPLSEHAKPSGRRREAALARRLGIRRVTTGELTIRRVRCGRGFSYVWGDGKRIRAAAVLRRLASLAVPPAYENVLYAPDSAAHIQAIGRDAAGRLQYRYHPEWEKVREKRKARRLIRLVSRLSQIRRAVARHLGGTEPTREFALAAAIELVAGTAIRAGDEAYARQRGTRGAATLLKSDVSVAGDMVTLSFRAKGGKDVCKELRSPRLCAALDIMHALPGKRLFQYRGADGGLHAVRRQDINAFLRELAGVHISLKDFRTLCASAMVLDALARTTPATSERQRRRQVRQAVQQAAQNLANTPAICRKSYVHETVVAAFEEGVLEGFATALKGCRSAARREQLVAEVLTLEA